MKGVDRRSEPRVECRQPARIEILGDAPRVFEATLQNISGRGASLSLSEPIPVNSMVRIDLGPAILLGDVCYCFQLNGTWQAGVQVAHSLRLDMVLHNLAEQLNQFGRAEGNTENTILGEEPGNTHSQTHQQASRHQNE